MACCQPAADAAAPIPTVFVFLIITSGAGKVCRICNFPIQNPDYFKWKEGLICFQDEPISDIMDKLSLYFDVKIQHRNQAFLKERYTGKFRSKDGVEQVLKVLQMEHHFRYVKDNEQNVITIK